MDCAGLGPMTSLLREKDGTFHARNLLLVHSVDVGKNGVLPRRLDGQVCQMSLSL